MARKMTFKLGSSLILFLIIFEPKNGNAVLKTKLPQMKGVTSDLLEKYKVEHSIYIVGQ